MEDKTRRIAWLIARHLQKDLSETEEAALQDWLNETEMNRIKFNEFIGFFESNKMQEDLKIKGYSLVRKEPVWQKILDLKYSQDDKVVSISHKKRYWSRFVAAAAVLMLILAGSYFFLFNQSQNRNSTTVSQNEPIQDIAPGGDKAVLILGDGTTLILDSLQNGLLASNGGASIVKQDGKVFYKTEAGKAINEVMYNTLRTPKKGEYKIKLPDGSDVFLNSISSIRYPTVFTGNERRVEITGEAYFEVAKDAGKPFKVSILGSDGNKLSEVVVLGTHFNINAYSDEGVIKTTLLEGSVKVKSESDGKNSEVVIRPGEQAILTTNHINGQKLSVVDKADTERAVAWVHGYFRFGDTDLKTVMRQLARWYDVEVTYSDNLPDISFSGEVRRNVNISEVLKVLEYFGARFSVKGNKITVMP